MEGNAVTYTQVASHRNRDRLWLEGRRLSAAGFTRGTRYRIEVNPERGYAHFIIDSEGDRVVSGRRRANQARSRPIIDICLSDLAPAGTRVRAIFVDGRIEVAIHHEERARLDRARRLQRALSWGTLREGSLCSGIGVSTVAVHQGLEDAGVKGEVEWLMEADGRYLEVADESNPAVTPGTTLFNGTLEEIEPELVTPVDVLSFSLPCDGHSRAGKSKRGIRRAESHDGSATAVFGLVRLLDAANPSALLSENVVEARDSATYELLVRELERRNYVVQGIVLDEEQAGSVEARRRWFFVALSRDIAEGFEIERVAPQPRVYERIRELLDDVPNDDPSWSDNTYLKEKAERDRVAGKGFANRALYTGEETQIATLRKFYNKRGSTDPMIVRDDGKERLLTPAEHARAKGIPEELVADIGATLAHEGLGQSGVWGHFYGLARLLGEHFRQLPIAPAAPIEGETAAAPPETQARRAAASPVTGFTITAVATDVPDEPLSPDHRVTTIDFWLDGAPYVARSEWTPDEWAVVALHERRDDDRNTLGNTRDVLDLHTPGGWVSARAMEQAIVIGFAHTLNQDRGEPVSRDLIRAVLEWDALQRAGEGETPKAEALATRVRAQLGEERTTPFVLAGLGAREYMPEVAAALEAGAWPQSREGGEREDDVDPLGVDKGPSTAAPVPGRMGG